MNKNTYIVLLVVTTALLAYTTFYTYTIPAITPVAAVATTTPPVIEEIPAKNILTTKTGKIIKIKETNESGESLSTITITTEGFATNTKITLEENKLTNFFLVDIDKDGFDELAIITTAQGSGSYGELTLFTTNNDKELTLVETPSITEDITKKGSLFEGYSGHDLFSVIDGMLVRQFPTYTASDTNSLPTGPSKKIFYTLKEINGNYTVDWINENVATATNTSPVAPVLNSASSSTKAVSTSTSQIATSTKKTPAGIR